MRLINVPKHVDITSIQGEVPTPVHFNLKLNWYRLQAIITSESMKVGLLV